MSDKILIFKSLDTNYIYLDTIDSGVSEDWTYTRDGDNYSLKKLNTNINQVVRTSYSKFVTYNENKEKVSFKTSDEFENFLIGILSNDNKFAKDVDVYTPKIIIHTDKIQTQKSDSTCEIEILGSFLDYIDDCVVYESNNNKNIIESSVVVKTFDKIVLSALLDKEPKDYTIRLTKNEQVFTLSFSSENMEIIIPSNDLDNNYKWFKNNSTRNNCDIGDGYYQAEQTNNGDGWNDSAYYGGFKTSNGINKISHSFVVDVDVNAYCYIRFNSNNNATTSGNPRIYISNGKNLSLTNSRGVNIYNGSVEKGYKIEVIITSSSLELVINGIVVATSNDNYTQSLENSFVTFTGYRNSRFTNILTKIFI